MDHADLTDAWWEDDQLEVRFNPRGAVVEVDRIGMEPALQRHVLFATSGSAGPPRLVALSKEALLRSARLVNAHLGCDATDRWIGSLPAFHVGGFGILARVYAAGGTLVPFDGKWAAGRLVARLAEEKVTVASLVPTQVHDLVQSGLSAPEPLRFAIVGGAALDAVLWEQALALGWPLRACYGMTETAAQVATQTTAEVDGALPLIEDWEARRETDGILSLRGASLLTGYVERDGDAWRVRDPCDAEGWFRTEDFGEVLPGNRLRIEGRGSRVVKVLGELVNLDRLEGILSRFGEGLIEAEPDARSGSRLVLVTADAAGAEALRERFNAEVAPFERVAEVRVVREIRRGGLGKPVRDP